MTIFQKSWRTVVLLFEGFMPNSDQFWDMDRKSKTRSKLSLQNCAVWLSRCQWIAQDRRAPAMLFFADFETWTLVFHFTWFSVPSPRRCEATMIYASGALNLTPFSSLEITRCLSCVTSPRASLLPRGKHSMDGAQSCLFTQIKACIMYISVDYIHLWESYPSMRYRNANTGRTGSNHQRRGDPIRADLCFFSNVRDHAERAYCWILPSIVRSNPWSTLKVISKAHLRT